ncbi:MAG: hypothetical protein ABEJ68_07635 [Halobacteriaceae archaeon]
MTDSPTGLRTPESQESYPVEVHRMGGREPDGTPTVLDRWTFSARKVRRVVEDVLTGDVLNATAGKTKLRHGGGEIVRNDINEDIDADHHLDVCVIDEHFEDNSFDVCILDPPFDEGQADERYGGFHARDINAARQALANLTRPGGRLVEFGWNSHGASAFPGWRREELHIFQRGPCLPDVFGVVDRNHQTTLPDGGER